MSVIQGNAFSDDEVDTGDIGHSLRFRGAQHLNRTFGAPTSGTSWACSWWQKDCTDGATKFVLGAGLAGFGFHSSNVFRIWDNGGGAAASSTALFRDPTGHSHYFVRSNGTNIKAYQNNVEIASYTGTITSLNSAIAHMVGRYANAAQDYLNDYLSRFAFVDNGGSLTPGDFAYLNTEINEWVSKSQSAVKAVVDAGGTNSTMLDFDDATSLTTLGYDKSSKGNHFTLNNFSLTAGTTYDHMLDVPGNSYATMNPIDQTLTSETEGNLKVTTNVGGYQGACRATQAFPSTGKWYWETVIASLGGSAGQAPMSGIMSAATGIATSAWTSYGYYGANGNRQQYTNGSLVTNAAYGATFTTGDVIGYAFDADAGTFTFYKNGVSQGQAFSGISGTYMPVIWDPATGGSTNINFGQAPLHASATYDSAAGGYFRYAPPTGFKALCQANLPEPAILNPKLHFDIKTRTGTAATYSVTGLGFQPDLLWSKSRGRAVDHALYDSVRGVQKQLESNSTGAETTETTGLTAFNSDGYTGGALDQINGTTATNSFVDWLWKAGGAAVSNTAGSITSQVSANVDAGFSIVTYTGTGVSGATIGHGLGKKPSMIVGKNLSGAAQNWQVWTGPLGDNALQLNLTNAQVASTANSVFLVAGINTTVFQVGNNPSLNGATTQVAYCFADVEGYSKAFSYTGNGSADGPYVHLGFKPRWLLIKRSDSAADWILIDTARDPYNHEGMSILYPHAGSAEYLGGTQDVDLLSNGFKPRDTHTAINASSGTYIGFAIADVAGKYSLGR